MAMAHAVVEAVDRRALILKKRVTRSLAMSVLAELGNAAAIADDWPD